MKNGINQSKSWGLVIVLMGLASLVSFTAGADFDPTDLMRACMANAKSDCENWAVKGGGGGGFPRGLGVETKVELAAGEKYILEGTIVIANNNVYLKADLEKQPWLASRKRKTNPFYSIDDSVGRWTKYENKSIAVIATAKAVVWFNGDKAFYEIQLEPGQNPVLEGFVKNDATQSCR